MKFTLTFILSSLFVTTNAYSAGYGNMAGGFSDGLQKGMAMSQQQEAQVAMIYQQRLAIRAQYGTKEIERLDMLAKNPESRLYEIFREFSTK